MIPCPRCGGDSIASKSRTSNRRPSLHGRVVIRWHKCRDCGCDFRSYQIVPIRREEYEVIEDAAKDTA